MERFRHISLLCGMTIFIGFGCSRPEPPRENASDRKGPFAQVQIAPDVNAKPGPSQDTAAPAPVVDGNLEKYEAALTEALNLMADRKYAEALVSLETART